MENAATPPKRAEPNWLLANLTDPVYARLAPAIDRVPAALKDVLMRPGVPLEWVYFPESGCLSVITVMGDGNQVEVGTIGWEGMLGVHVLHGAAAVPTECVVQIAGHVRRIARSVFEAELRASDELRGMMNGYAQVWCDQVSRGGSCNAVHTIDARLARWLLVTRDRLPSDVLPLTQEFLAIMLGVRRASVTVAALALQADGVITYNHGKITVVDRAALEGAACECYGSIRAMYTDRLSTPASHGRASRAS